MLANITRVLIIAFLGFGGYRAPAQDIQALLRLKVGNSWVYSGTVEWTVVDTNPPRFGKKRIRWKSEIMDAVDRGELKAFLVHGSVFDLPWYEPDDEPGEYIWMVYRNRFYSLSADSKILTRFHDPNDSLIDLVIAEEPILQFPSRLNKCTIEVKPEEPRQRDDLHYCWYLQKKRTQELKIDGVRDKVANVWTARYYTAPSHELLGFASGIGFVSFDFSHHGTLSEAHVKLVEAHLR